MSPDNTATTWCDLADQLTAEQFAELEYCERENIPPKVPPAMPEERQRGLLNMARSRIAENLAQAMNAGIAPPPEAASLCPWESWDDGFMRLFVIATHDVGFASVELLGVQHDDGRIERHILAPEADNLTAAQSRALAAALCEVADLLETFE